MASAVEEREVDIFEQLSKHFGDRSLESGLEYTQLAKGQLDTALMGDMVHSPIKKGALVISVDGEGDDDTALMQFEKISYMGRFVGMKMVNPHYYRIYFTTRNGYFYENSKNVRDRLIQHPLSQRGFLVPAKDGMRILDKGSVLLVSRYGIFSQVEGYQQASKFQREAVKEKGRSQHYMSLHEEAVIKLDTLQEEIDNLYLRNISLGETVRELQGLKAELVRQKERAEGFAKNLKAKAEYSQDVLEHNRRQLEEEMSKFSRYISDILMVIERQEIEDSYRAMRSSHPTLTKDFEKQLLHKWQKEGIMKENEVKVMQKRLNEMEDEIKRREAGDLDEEVSRQSEEGSGRDTEAGYGNEDTDSSEGVEKGESEGKGAKGRSGLSRVLSRAAGLPSKAVSKLADLKERATRDKEEASEERQDESSAGDDEDGI